MTLSMTLSMECKRNSPNVFGLNERSAQESHCLTKPRRILDNLTDRNVNPVACNDASLAWVAYRHIALFGALSSNFPGHVRDELPA